MARSTRATNAASSTFPSRKGVTSAGMTPLKRSLLQLLMGTAVALGAAGSAVQAPAQVQSPVSAQPMGYSPSTLSAGDSSALASALRAVKSGDLAGADAYRLQISDPVAQKLVRWAAVDSRSTALSFLELDAARRDLSAWPRSITRQSAAERVMETSNMPPDRTIAWFDGAPPQTAQGAMALAGALQAQGKTAEAKALIRSCGANGCSRRTFRRGCWGGLAPCSMLPTTVNGCAPC
jgi:hypothetical protein